ncbi:MAG: hypothetical protein LBK42_11880 [Propionibacteriaceae bacterium]|jgi:hypothetical protein|nr:hypothetical protein [Propionibacteriaceae bacterium]
MESALTPRVIIRPGLLDRLKRLGGIVDDEAFARLIGMPRAELDRLRGGKPPSTLAIAMIAKTFGLGVGEVATLAEPADVALEHAA